MEQLFSNISKNTAPLADRMRPRTLDEFVGQQHIVGEGKLLRRAILSDRLQSAIFFGPPGTGKTTLASLYFRIASSTTAGFRISNFFPTTRFAPAMIHFRIAPPAFSYR